MREKRDSYTALLLRTGGTITVTSSGDVLSSGVGGRNRDAVLLHSDQEATLWFGGADASCLIIWVPDHRTVGLGLQGDRPVVLHRTVLVSAVQAMVSATIQGSQSAQVDRQELLVLERMLVGVVVALLIDSGEPGEDTAAAISNIDLAHSLILAHLRDPRFGIAELAGYLQMSRRNVQRLFARVGTTPTATIRRFRAELAVPLLAERHATGVSVEEIASKVGFTSAAAMRRAIRETEATPDDRPEGGPFGD